MFLSFKHPRTSSTFKSERWNIVSFHTLDLSRRFLFIKMNVSMNKNRVVIMGMSIIITFHVMSEWCLFHDLEMMGQRTTCGKQRSGLPVEMVSVKSRLSIEWDSPIELIIRKVQNWRALLWPNLYGISPLIRFLDTLSMFKLNKLIIPLGNSPNKVITAWISRSKMNTSS